MNNDTHSSSQLFCNQLEEPKGQRLIRKDYCILVETVSASMTVNTLFYLLCVTINVNELCLVLNWSHDVAVGMFCYIAHVNSLSTVKLSVLQNQYKHVTLV